MERQPVTSAVLKSIGYDPHARVLEVEFLPRKGFKKGSVWQYRGFTSQDYQNLRAAKSLGSHFTQHIRDSFRAHKIEEAEREDQKAE
jgi:KTSC domain